MSTQETEAALLRLLVSDAPLEELQAFFREARRGRLDADALARLEGMFDDAVALHEARAESMHRARGLAALSDTAADLATRRDLDGVLAAICRRARSLLGTDAAYITLHDDEQHDTYVRMTDGIVSDAFRTMRLPPGKGLGGLVATSGRAEATSDYAADPRFTHLDMLDQRVTLEGLRGIVAVPVRRGDDILGVVLSGSRSVRRFDPGEISLLESLATHAGIAIENARLFATVTALHDRSRRSAELQQTLSSLVLGGAGLPEVLATIAAAVGGHLVLVDERDGTTLEAGQAHATPGADEELVHELRAGSELLGRLTLTGINREDCREIVDRAGTVVAGLLVQMRVRGDAEQRLLLGLLEDVLAGELDDEQLRKRSSRLGVELDGDLIVLVGALPESLERWAAISAGREAAREGGMAGLIDGRTTIVVPSSALRVVADAWSTRLTAHDGERPTLGVAGPARGADGIREAHRQARRALQIALALDRRGHAVAIEDLGLAGAVLGSAPVQDLPGFVDRTLGPVLRHDGERGTALQATLAAFFDHTGHLANTARALDVHINTLYQRLERLDHLLGDDWRTPERRLELQLALYIRTVDGRLAQLDPGG